VHQGLSPHWPAIIAAGSPPFGIALHFHEHGGAPAHGGLLWYPERGELIRRQVRIENKDGMWRGQGRIFWS
jgi:hypothetical protein